VTAVRFRGATRRSARRPSLLVVVPPSRIGPGASMVRQNVTPATSIAPQGGGSTSSTLSAGAFTLCADSNAYGRRVSGAMENRAAVFTSQPQAVEVYQAGTWWAGELLGWRHDADGSCQVWVRVVLGGVEETAWTDLATLRLPERHLAVATESSRRFAPETQEMSVARHPAGRRARAEDSASTAGLPRVPDLAVVPDRTAAPLPSGRRRAPEEPELASAGGRRRAPEEVSSPSSGGRRRAPEPATAERPAVHPSPGRHRAAGDPGRHRTADTGLFPVVAAADRRSARDEKPASGSGWSVPAARPPRPEERVERARDGWAAPDGLEPDLLTRPMRLSDQLPHSRRPRVDGSVRRS
jgi:hypothetical protein